MPFCIADQHGGWPEAHRLIVEQRAEKSGGVIAFQPGALVHNHRECRGVAFREGVAAEGAQLVEDGSGDGIANPLCLRAGYKGIVQLRDGLIRALRSERAPQLLPLAGGKAGQIARDLQHLLLKQDDAQSFRKRTFKQRMCVGYWLQPLAAAQIGMHHIPLQWPGPDERNRHDQIIKALWLEARQHLRLCPRFDLEYPDGVRTLRSVANTAGSSKVSRSRSGAAPVVVPHQIDRLGERGQHAQAQDIDLDQTSLLQRILIPLRRPCARPSPPARLGHACRQRRRMMTMPPLC